MVAPLRVAVPEMGRYEPHGGIGRVVQSLAQAWGERVILTEASFDRSRMPILRNSPSGIDAPKGTDVILLPQLTGSEALRRTRGVRGVVIVHDVGVVDSPLDISTTDRVSHLLVKRSFYGLRHAARIVAVSEFTREALVRHLPQLKGRVSVISNGVDARFLQNAESTAVARRKLLPLTDAPLGEPLLIYVGTELPRKNVAVLLETLSALKRRHPQAQLLKVGRPGGDRWRRVTLEKMDSLGLTIGRDVHLLEEIDDTVLASAYRAADVIVSASLYEGFCLPAIEALATGTPVVVSNRGALPEVVGNGGKVVPPQPQYLLAAVEATLRSPRPALPGKSLPTWADAAESYLELLIEVAGTGAVSSTRPDSNAVKARSAIRESR